MTCKDPPISTMHDRDVALLLATLAEIEALTLTPPRPPWREASSLQEAS